METKMKKIPFDLEKAKKGEAFRLNGSDITDSYYLGYFGNRVWHRWCNEYGEDDDISEITQDWHHPIPDEPKAERWALVHEHDFFNSIEDAEKRKSLLLNQYIYTVVKLADDE